MLYIIVICIVCIMVWILFRYAKDGTDRLSVVVVHNHYKKYLERAIDITSKTNHVILIGDEEVRHLGNMGNVEYVDISRYSQKREIQELRKYFVNQSPNPGHFEWWCFQRIFVLKYFCEERKLKRVFHMDSDNIMLYDVNTYPYQEENAYQIMHNYETWRIGNSVHAGVVSLDMCNAFMQLYKEIYINKVHNYYVSGKIEQYKNGKRGDGVSDMTFYYILQKEGRIKAQDLSIPMKIGGKKYVFLNNVNTAEGYASSDQYEKAGDIIKIIKNREGEYMIYDKIHNEYHIIYNIHFQGIGKRYLELEGEPWVQQTNLNRNIKLL